MSKFPKILLLCSGRLAVPTLQWLAQEGRLTGIVVPDADPKATHLFQQLASSFQCPFHSIVRSEFTMSLTHLCSLYNPDVVFVIGFPWRIPEVLLSIPPCGFLNFHGGVLPELRGPDPIFEAIRQELPETALTVHRMDAGWDTGPIIYEQRFALTTDLTHGLLSTQLAYQCAQVTPVLLKLLQQGMPPLRQQTTSRSVYYRRADATDLYIQWETQSAAAINALIRACNPVYGGAATLANGWTFRVVEALSPPNLTHNAAPGTLLALDEAQGALIQCRDNAVLQARVIGTDEGYFPAARLHEFGIMAGTIFAFPNTQKN